MRHLQTTTVTRRISKGIVRRKKRNSRKLISPRVFGKLNNGIISMKVFGGIVCCKFLSETNNKRAHAWSDTPAKAYRSMLRNYHLKYAS
jgi:hypothetical protein